MERRFGLLPALAFAVLASTIPALPVGAAAPSGKVAAGTRVQGEQDLTTLLRRPHSLTPAPRPSAAPRLAPLAAPACSSTFNSVSSPNPGGGDNFFANNGLRALSPRNVWAVGLTSNTSVSPWVAQTLIEHWDGGSWSQVASPNV